MEAFREGDGGGPRGNSGETTTGPKVAIATAARRKPWLPMLEPELLGPEPGLASMDENSEGSLGPM